MARKARGEATATGSRDEKPVTAYTLDVFLQTGPITKGFAKKNPVISRRIQIRGDQTLKDLHVVIFQAYGRWDEHLYEFQFGKRPMDPKGPRYAPASLIEDEIGGRAAGAGRVDKTIIDSLELKVGRVFGYWFDFGDSWYHQIVVEAVDDVVPSGKFPKVTKRVGKSPPQYPKE